MDSGTLTYIRYKLDHLEIGDYFYEWLDTAEPEDLHRINLKLLSKSLKTPINAILSDILRAVRRGVFILSWDYHCPHCNAIPDFHHSLSEAKSEGFCPICDVSFRNILDQNIEVTFTPHPAILPMPVGLEDEFKKNMYEAARKGTYSLPPEFLTGFECMNNPVFRELFGDQILSLEESLEIRHVTILFTDIKGSTRLYTELGDSRSYDIVREHFKILYNSIQRNDGVVIKTIGDAVMGSFTTPEQGIRAATEAYNQFKAINFDPVGNLQIKMGLHEGGAIAVTMNGKADYFGNTINTAARIQQLGREHSISFSEAVFDNPGVKRHLKSEMDKHGVKIYKKKGNLRGVSDNFVYYTLRT